MLSNKGISAIMRGTSLNRADPFVKMSVTAVLSGMASKASGGDFVQGAMSAMVVWLYNDTKQEAKQKEYAMRSKGIRMLAVQLDPKDPNSWHLMEENRALEWKTKGNPKTRAEASENTAHFFEFIAAYSKGTPASFMYPIAKGLANMAIMDKYLLLNEAGESFPVHDAIIDVVSEIVPMPTEKQKFWRDISIDLLYDELKE